MLSWLAYFCITSNREAKSLYLTTTVPISDVAKFADKDTEIRVKGKLHTEPPVVARDGKHSYSFQYVQLGKLPTERF